MCEKCNTGFTTSELEEQLLDAREDYPLEDDEYNAPFSPIPLFTENLVEEIEFNSEAFQEGVDSVSCVCGKLTALINVGLTPENALEYLMNQEIIESNYRMGLLDKEKTIAVAKEHCIAVEKNSI